MKQSDNEQQEIISRAKQGDNAAMEALLTQYKPTVRNRTRSFFLVGGEAEDLIQEGMIGLYKAIRDYDVTKGAFGAFASLCIDRQISTAIKKSLRVKHKPLNEYISLTYSDDGEDEYINYIGNSSTDNPQDLILEQEGYQRLKRRIDTEFSPLEKKVLGLFLEGLSYSEIGAQVNKDTKSVDNAIQRIRNKLIDHD